MKQVKEIYPKVYLYTRIVKAKLFIDGYFFNNIDLDNISDEAYFSKFHFIRLFKQIYGKTPHQYLVHVRIENAKRHLEKDRPVAETCYAVGLESISSFTGLFKKITGETPSGYRRAYHLRQVNIKEAPLEFIPNCFAEQTWPEKTAILKKPAK